MSLSLTLTFDETFYSEVDPLSGGGGGSATNAEVPAVWDVAIGGHGYMLDLGSENNPTGFHHESIPTLRQVFIEGDSLGEKDINPESLWRFSDRDWSHGAGQRNADLPTSDTSMFWQSKGIDPWTQWQISLLPDTTQVRASANANLQALGVGGFLYLVDGIQVLFTNDLSTYTAVAGLPSAQVTGICTDGFNVYIAMATHGVYQTTRGAVGAATHFVTSAVTLDTIAFTNGRLMASEGPAIFNIISPTAAVLPAALFTHNNSDFVWVGFASGALAIYAGGFSADHSEVYQIGIASDGTALTVPILAAPDLITGETLLSVGSYEGFVFLGTNSGVRLCIADSTGNLSVGALLLTGPARCFVGFDRFVWFGWDDFDTQSTGLGRVDLSVEASNGAPAYASDLMVTAQAPVLSVDNFNGARIFAVGGQGFYTQSPNLVNQGFIDSGLITYDIPDSKIALYLTVRTLELDGAVQSQIAVDGGVFQNLGVHNQTSPTDIFTIPELQGFTFEIRETLIPSIPFPTLGPVIQRHMLEALPVVNSGLFMFVPILLEDNCQVRGGAERPMDVVAERAFLYNLRATAQRVIYQELVSSFSVTVDDVTWTADRMTQNNEGYNATMLLKLKSV